MQLTFSLYSTTARMIRLHKPLLEPLGLTFPQYLVLVALLEKAPQSVGELGAKVGMDTGTITPLVKRLEKAALLTRRRDAHDDRRVMVELTTQGLELGPKVATVPERINSACQITDARADEIRQSLEAMGRGSE